ncbi:SDR family oxidoreductase [Photobacterium sp. ZSDE20]|uniref:SDR family oxidoreductase n=2 Tax=Photobacterium pectinilyticum TaxID=2906793 RepID=A0ABT1N8K3_9GAMM|nr:SDR family oxidoreductase [Photobacterium sp. ZSDE20]MDD1826966.1 SDR family oxidoreductase [Photobacterium sp. ZSDE20]
MSQGYTVSPVQRRATGAANTIVMDISPDSSWQPHLENVGVIIHCAGRAHVMSESAVDPITEYRKVNTSGTLQLATQAAEAGVKRFIFISSIKVNGEATEPGQPFTTKVEHPPEDPYGLSKYEAEHGLRLLAEQTGMEVVIIRPPLVYGPGVKANFASLIKLASKGLPLPLGAIENQRSMVFVGNLVDLIINCIRNPNAANKTFLASDDDDLSTTQLLEGLASAMNKPSRLLPIPSSWLLTLTKLLGKPAIGQRLCGNLQLDISDTKTCLGWKPPYSVAEGLKQTVTEASRQK